MIVGRETMTFSQCFVELDEAISAIQRETGDTRVIALNAHRGDAPPGSIILQTENVPTQVADPRAMWPTSEIWDISASNAAKYGATHFPVGYHPSMERFKRAKDLDIDVVFSGAINERRAKVLNELIARGLHVVVVPIRAYGRQRDALLARAKLALNLLFYEDGIFPVLRVAHLVANHVPVLSETCLEVWDEFVPTCDFKDIVDQTEQWVKHSTRVHAAMQYDAFRAMPMMLPS